MGDVQLQHIFKYYDNHQIPAVQDFHLHIEDKEFIVLVGPSGCGKSTTLRMIAGLEDISEGDLILDGKRVNDIPPKDRNIAMVFQNYALYSHMTVFDNLAFNLKLSKVPKQEIQERVGAIANMLGLTQFLKRKPKALSGGQRQRVALGRAIIREAKYFLMDEPLSNLDATLRAQMRGEIIKLHQRLQRTTIYVTHDQTEAMTMATRIVVMKDGEIQQVGTPREVYNHPENIFVASFIGSPPMNFLGATLQEGKLTMGDKLMPISDDKMKELREKGYADAVVTVGIRPEDLHLTEGEERAPYRAVVDVVELMGSEVLLYLQSEQGSFIAKVGADIEAKTGDTVEIYLDMNKVHFFDKETGYRIC